MESEFKKWLEYLETIEPPVNSEIELTEYQKEDIDFAKKMIEKLGRKIYGKNKENRK